MFSVLYLEKVWSKIYTECLSYYRNSERNYVIKEPNLHFRLPPTVLLSYKITLAELHLIFSGGFHLTVQSHFIDTEILLS